MPNPLSGKEALNKEFLNVMIRILLYLVAGRCVDFMRRADIFCHDIENTFKSKMKIHIKQSLIKF